ncbi:DUF885 domain-containing protein [Caulobacter sp. NIBR2454]|uniref:DUF885 domain-containing protein n=1 Tax=Caulobacter sp. NIBR2454 TaxID=3015996 RepID=UPI003FA41489
MQETLQRSPEYATMLGLDKGPMASLKGRFGEASLAARAKDKADNSRYLAELRAIDRSKLTGMDVINYDTVLFTLETAEKGNKAFNYGSPGSGQPYIISQLTGSYQQIPDFLDAQHGIETADDAEAYLSRLSAFAKVLDGEVEIARHDAGVGVIPPDFAIDRALTTLGNIHGEPSSKSTLVQSVVRRTKAKSIAGDWEARATKIYEGEVQPALGRQIAFLKEVRPKAVHDAGVWRLPKGGEYYGVSLLNYTTAAITPEEIHTTGLRLVDSISKEIDAIFKSQGMTEGSVGARLQQLSKRPDQLYANTDEAKVELISDLNKMVKEIEAKIAPYFGQLPKAALEIRRVPKSIEAGAPGGYYNSPTLDGSRPGIYWINLRNSAEVPKFGLKTLTYHEGIPGHHLQLALNNESQGIPLIRKAIGFSGYSEGWALYSEELAVEMGMYKDDPFGHVGQLQAALFRAVRLVVDSGMHYKKWSREQAIKYFVDNLGQEEATATTEIERYCVWPGQACSYMVGKLIWLRLRDKARTALGAKFDYRKFHDTGLLAGGTPLTVLENAIDGYIASAKAA